jgi:hypothetical protein
MHFSRAGWLEALRKLDGPMNSTRDRRIESMQRGVHVERASVIPAGIGDGPPNGPPIGEGTIR